MPYLRSRFRGGRPVAETRILSLTPANASRCKGFSLVFNGLIENKLPLLTARSHPREFEGQNWLPVRLSNGAPFRLVKSALLETNEPSPKCQFFYLSD